MHGKSVLYRNPASNNNCIQFPFDIYTFSRCFQSFQPFEWNAVIWKINKYETEQLRSNRMAYIALPLCECVFPSTLKWKRVKPFQLSYHAIILLAVSLYVYVINYNLFWCVAHKCSQSLNGMWWKDVSICVGLFDYVALRFVCLLFFMSIVL